MTIRVLASIARPRLRSARATPTDAIDAIVRGVARRLGRRRPARARSVGRHSSPVENAS